MAITLVTSSSLPSIRRRLPIVGAFCMLSLGLTNLYTPLRSNFSRLTAARSLRMEANTDTVPSIVVYVTVPNRDSGKKLAESLVTEKLAACVNIVPGLQSIYQWEGKIETDSEEMLIIKTRQSLLEALTEHVKKNHEYDVPEVISLPITGGNLEYLRWLKNSTRD